MQNAPISGKVGIVAGGGSGHNPAFIGYIGKTCWMRLLWGKYLCRRHRKYFIPHLKMQMQAKALLCLCGNYAADLSSTEKAIEMAKAEGIVVKK